LGVEHIVELCDHLQVVFHVLFLNLDSPNALIHRHARIFLTNLIYSLTSGQVGKLEKDSPAARFLAKVDALGDRPPWAYEDPTIVALDIESAKQLGQWVSEVVTLLPSFSLLPSSWGAEGIPSPPPPLASALLVRCARVGLTSERVQHCRGRPRSDAFRRTTSTVRSTSTGRCCRWAAASTRRRSPSF
jgi:hypothetical protein